MTGPLEYMDEAPKVISDPDRVGLAMWWADAPGNKVFLVVAAHTPDNKWLKGMVDEDQAKSLLYGLVWQARKGFLATILQKLMFWVPLNNKEKKAENKTCPNVPTNGR